MATQKERVLNYLRSKGPLTSLTAQERLGVLNLPGRISELRREGHNINKAKITVTNRFDEPVQVKRYSMADGGMA